MTASTTRLSVRALRTGYGSSRVVHGIDIEVGDNEVVALLGANGAGRTTTLRAVAGCIPWTGSIDLDGTSTRGCSTESLVRRGLALVPEGRGTLADLTVAENLRVGGYVHRRSGNQTSDYDRCYEWFPILYERRHQAAGSLSGGQQQMLAVARALMARPSILLLDEPSQGLSPIAAEDVFSRLGEINSTLGTAMLVVEQNAHLALSLATRGYVLEAGEIALHGDADRLLNHSRVSDAYLGA